MNQMLYIRRSIRQNLRLGPRLRNSHLGGVLEINNLFKSSRKKLEVGSPSSSRLMARRRGCSYTISVFIDFLVDNLPPWLQWGHEQRSHKAP